MRTIKGRFSPRWDDFFESDSNDLRWTVPQMERILMQGSSKPFDTTQRLGSDSLPKKPSGVLRHNPTQGPSCLTEWEWRRAFGPHLSSPGFHRALDVGSGNGACLRMLSESLPTASLDWIEPDPKLFELSRRACQGRPLGSSRGHPMSFETYCAFPRQRYCVTHASFSLSFTPSSLQALIHLMGMTKASGMVVLQDFVVPARLGPRQRWVVRELTRAFVTPNTRPGPEQVLVDLARSNGCDLVSCTVLPVPLERVQGDRGRRLLQAHRLVCRLLHVEDHELTTPLHAAQCVFRKRWGSSGVA
jgi:hypothetical protein